MGEECLAVAALQTLKEESSPSRAPCSEDEARGADLQLNLGSHKRSNKYCSNILCRWHFLRGKAFLNGLCGPAIAGTPASIASSWHPLPPRGILQTFHRSTNPRSRAIKSVPEKFSGLTTYLLTAKSKSTCLNGPFPVNEAIHHRSSFAHACSF